MSQVTFLLVDDLDENLLALEALLRREDLTLLKARSGDEALELLLQHDVALALVDVQMPGLDGFELAELMRGNERTRRVPIIFVTAGSADTQRRFRGYEAGAVDFIQKPIEPGVLRSKADVFFELFRQRQQIAVQRDELERMTEVLREAGRRKDESLLSLTQDISQHEDERARQSVLLREVNHRIKNLFSVTAGLVSLSARASKTVDELADDLRSRLQALAVAHDLTLPDLAEDNDATKKATSVMQLLRAIVAPHEHSHASRIEIRGHDAPLAPDTLTSFALLLHELTTNAAKYGALASAGGKLTVDIVADDQNLMLQWTERSDFVVESREREGFGTILERAAVRGLGGSLTREWTQTGLRLELSVPIKPRSGP